MKKQKSTMQKVVQVVVWLMLIVTVLSSVIVVLSAFQ